MQAALRYIDRKYPGAEFSRIYYAQSSVVSGISQMHINLNDQGAEAILTRTVQCNSSNSAIKAFTLSFNNNEIFYSSNSLTGLANLVANITAPCVYVFDGSTLSIVCSDPLTSFIISYQYLHKAVK